MLKADYSGALSLLLRYPSPQPHEPYDFVNDALYLEQNPTAERGSFLISQYSGKAPEGTKRQSSQQPARQARLWQDFTSRSELGPLARNSPKSFESLFQDVSQGIQRRTESWGVAKAVRGAVTEARKNMQTMHYDPPSRAATGRHQKKPSATSRISETPTELGLEKKISLLEQRNKEISTALGEALRDLRSELTKTKELDSSSNDAMAQALARAESVQQCLDDPSRPVVPAKPAMPAQVPVGDQAEQPKQPEKPQATKVDKREEVALNDQQGTHSNADAGGPSAQSGVHEPVSIATGRQKLSGQTDGERARPERTFVRPSLTDSGFSWMLEGSKNASSFVSSASVPPEQSRHHDHARNTSKSNSLFGNGDDRVEPDAEYDELALRSLRGAQGPL